MILKLVNVRYAMSLNSYQKYISLLRLHPMSVIRLWLILWKTVILYRALTLKKSLRRYTDGKCFAKCNWLYRTDFNRRRYDALSKEDQGNFIPKRIRSENPDLKKSWIPHFAEKG